MGYTRGRSQGLAPDMKYTVTASLSVLDALTKVAPDSSKTSLRSWIREGRVAVDGEVAVDGSAQVNPSQTVVIGPKARVIECHIRILYEDAHIVVVDKPPKLLSVATKTETARTVHNFLKKHFPELYVVHRLDKDTSGLMLFALSAQAREALDALFEKHAIKRCYTGVVEGQLEESTGTWESYLYEDDQYRVHSSPLPGRGVLATTHYDLVTGTKKFSLVTFTLETGKKNQIRVHCQEASHPIVGDKKYGAVTDPIKRVCLHAHALTLLHPVTQKPLHFTSPVPKEFRMLTR